MFGLLDRDIKYIKGALSKFEEIEQAVIFGSRAMGNYKKGSDVDLAIMGEKISNEKLKKHIDDEGKVIFER